MRAQVTHPLDVDKRDNVEIQVFRDDDGSTQSQSVAYVEIPDDAVYIQDQRQVDNYQRCADQIRAVALTQAQSARVIRERRAALD